MVSGSVPTTPLKRRPTGQRPRFSVAGVLAPIPLAPEIDRSALIGAPVARELFRYDGHPTRIYVRTVVAATESVASLLANTVDPQHPDAVTVSNPSDLLAARLAVAGASTALFLALGAIALLVGGIGIANVMLIGVLERRSEIGLRRALGAARRHVAGQFLVESLLVSVIGGLAGVAAGVAITTGMAHARGWQMQIPTAAMWGALAVAAGIGALAGLYPSTRAARLSPTEALRTV